MIISIHKLFLLKKFIKKIFLVSIIFFILVMIINLIEEANFLKESETSFLTHRYRSHRVTQALSAIALTASIVETLRLSQLGIVPGQYNSFQMRTKRLVESDALF